MKVKEKNDQTLRENPELAEPLAEIERRLKRKLDVIHTDIALMYLLSGYSVTETLDILGSI